MLTRSETVDVGHGRGRLAPDAAASLLRVDADLGRPLGTNSLWRDPDTQQDLFDAYVAYVRYQRGIGPWAPWAPLALPPGESVHCDGAAADTDEHANPAVVALLNEHGWVQTVWRWVDGRRELIEPWHFERQASRDRHANRPASSGAGVPLLNDEDHDMEDTGFYFHDGTDRPYRWFSRTRGKSRPIPSAEWAALRAVQTGGNPKLPLPVTRVSPQWYDKFVQLGTY